MGKSSKKSATKVESAVVIPAPTKPLTKGKREAQVPAKKDVVKKQKVEEKKILTKKVESSSEEGSDSESEELPKTALPAKNNKAKSDSEDDSSDVEDESSSDEEAAPVTKAPAVEAVAKKEDSSDDESEEDASSDEEEKAPAKPTVASAKKKDESSDSEDGSESDDDDKSDQEESSGDEEEAKTPKKNGADVKMTDAEKTPKAPSTPKEQGTGPKTLFVGNMAFSVEKEDVENFFKPAGEVVDVRFAMKDDSFRGFGHVEFATHEEAKKALDELNGKDLCGRAVRLDLAREKGAYTPSGNETQSYQKGGKSEGGKTVFVKGFDKYKSEDETRSALQEHFGSCGEMTRVSIPTDRETGDLKGMAYIDFTDNNSFTKALELDGSEFGDRSLTVNEATPRVDSGGGGGFGGRSGGFSGGRGRGGRSSGGGGRFGRGDRDSGRGRGRRGGRDSGRVGRGPSVRPAGRKTTFD